MGEGLFELLMQPGVLEALLQQNAPMLAPVVAQATQQPQITDVLPNPGPAPLDEDISGIPHIGRKSAVDTVLGALKDETVQGLLGGGGSSQQQQLPGGGVGQMDITGLLTPFTPAPVNFPFGALLGGAQ